MEGSCTIAYDIEADGSASNIAPACASDFFEHEAITAIRLFEHTPMMVDGIAVASPGHGTKLTFVLEE